MEVTKIYVSVSFSNEDRDNEPNVVSTNLTLEGCIRDTKIADRELAFEVYGPELWQEFEITEQGLAQLGSWWHGYSEATGTSYWIQVSDLGE